MSSRTLHGCLVGGQLNSALPQPFSQLLPSPGAARGRGGGKPWMQCKVVRKGFPVPRLHPPWFIFTLAYSSLPRSIYNLLLPMK